MAFQKVQRKAAKMRVAVAGPSGAGKTLSALYLAYGVTGDWGKIALIDTEHGRGQFYGNRSDLEVGEYLYQELVPPFTVERYIAIAKEAEQAVGPDGVVIIDSFSHAWEGEGGVLDFKELTEQQQGKNSFTAWSDAGKKQNTLINSVFDENGAAVFTAEKGHKKGDKITLKNTTLYASSMAKSGTKKSGSFYLYDGVEVNGRYRITTKVGYCGRTPIGKYVTGWVDKKDM